MYQHRHNCSPMSKKQQIHYISTKAIHLEFMDIEDPGKPAWKLRRSLHKAVANHPNQQGLIAWHRNITAGDAVRRGNPPQNHQLQWELCHALWVAELDQTIPLALSLPAWYSFQQSCDDKFTSFIKHQVQLLARELHYGSSTAETGFWQAKHVLINSIASGRAAHGCEHQDQPRWPECPISSSEATVLLSILYNTSESWACSFCTYWYQSQHLRLNSYQNKILLAPERAKPGPQWWEFFILWRVSVQLPRKHWSC